MGKHKPKNVPIDGTPTPASGPAASGPGSSSSSSKKPTGAKKKKYDTTRGFSTTSVPSAWQVKAQAEEREKALNESKSMVSSEAALSTLATSSSSGNPSSRTKKDNDKNNGPSDKQPKDEILDNFARVERNVLRRLDSDASDQTSTLPSPSLILTLKPTIVRVDARQEEAVASAIRLALGESRFLEDSIKSQKATLELACKTFHQLLVLGFSEENAITAMDATSGSLDSAAEFLTLSLGIDQLPQSWTDKAAHSILEMDIVGMSAGAMLPKSALTVSGSIGWAKDTTSELADKLAKEPPPSFIKSFNPPVPSSPAKAPIIEPLQPVNTAPSFVKSFIVNRDWDVSDSESDSSAKALAEAEALAKELMEEQLFRDFDDLTTDLAEAKLSKTKSQVKNIGRKLGAVVCEMKAMGLEIPVTANPASSPIPEPPIKISNTGKPSLTVCGAPPSQNPKIISAVDEELPLLDIFDNDIPLPAPKSTPQQPTDQCCDLTYINWTGKTPRSLLQTLSRQRVAFFPLDSKRGIRTGVKVGEKRYQMPKNVYVETKKEGEDYASTIALYDLFSDRNLRIVVPRPCRDLIDEWSSSKSNQEEDTRIKDLKHRFELVQGVVDRAVKAPEKSNNDMTEFMAERNQKSLSIHSSSRQKTFIPLQLQDLLAARKSSPLYQKLLQKRQQLPIYQHRASILSEINKDPICIISGATGSGKSTQIPSFIIEDSIERGVPCQVLVCQPRRISTVSIAERVALEMADPVDRSGAALLGKRGSWVGYSIRLENKVGEDTMMTFMTTGILLKRIEQDKLLESITHIVVDEVHERSADIDILLALLKTTCSLRTDLKVILMSATLDVNSLSRYYGGLNVVEVPGRTFPVHVHYIEDVLAETGYVLDRGSEYEIRHAYSAKSVGTVDVSSRGDKSHKVQLWVDEEDTGPVNDLYDQYCESLQTYSDPVISTLKRMNLNQINYELLECLLLHLIATKHPGGVLVFLPGIGEIRRAHDQLLNNRVFAKQVSVLVLPLHSSLSTAEQQSVFDIPEKGTWKIILSTNIAETGVTIEDILYVIDTGKVKEVSYNERKDLTELNEVFVSKASSKQRTGRAGRVTEGHCYCLYLKWYYEHKMPAMQQPEISRLSLEEVCLQIKLLGVTDLPEFFEGLLAPPPRPNIDRAISNLFKIQAIDEDSQLTPLGLHLGRMPGIFDPRFAKMLIYSSIFRCVDPILTITAGCSLGKSIFQTPYGSEESANMAKKKFIMGDSDLLAIWKAYSLWKDEFARRPNQIWSYCRQHFLNHSSLLMMERHKWQLLKSLIDIGFVDRDKQLGSMRGEETTKKMCPVPEAFNVNSHSESLLGSVIAIGLYDKILQVTNNKAERQGNTELQSPFLGEMRLFPHPRSMSTLEAPTEWISYRTLMKTSTSRVFACELTPAPPVGLVLAARDCHLQYTKKLIILDDKIAFQCWPRTAVMLRLSKRLIWRILEQKVFDPKSQASEAEEQILMTIVKNVL